MAVNGALQPQHRLGPFTPVPEWRPRLKSYSKLEGRNMIGSEEAVDLMKENGLSMDDLLQALVVPAAEMALPYLSGYYVGAVALGASGSIYFGANLEFPAGGNLSQSVHAEQCLTANLLRHQERAVHTIAISAPPCGHCRQFFSEFACAESMRILFGPPPNNVHTLAQILPFRFGPRDLLENPQQPLLLQQQSHALQWTERAQRLLNLMPAAVQEAADTGLARARGSYSPYTQCPAAAVLISPFGVHIGSLAESAAHSPSYQPLQAAFSIAMLDGLRNFADVKQVVLIEKEVAPLQQENLARALLASVSPHAEIIVLNVRLASST